jgi:hypothetical protein
VEAWPYINIIFLQLGSTTSGNQDLDITRIVLLCGNIMICHGMRWKRKLAGTVSWTPGYGYLVAIDRNINLCEENSAAGMTSPTFLNALLKGKSRQE